jgi:hypothetical protein
MFERNLDLSRLVNRELERLHLEETGTPYTWTRTDDFVHTGMYLRLYVLVCESTKDSE